MSYDPRIEHQSFDSPGREHSHAFDVEIIKSRPEGSTLSQNSEPTQSSLKSFQTDFLVQPLVISNRSTPLGIVVLDVLFVLSAPPTPFQSIGPSEIIWQVFALTHV